MKHLITACALAALSLVAQAQSVPAPEAPLLPTNPKLEWAIKVVALQQGPDMDRLVTQLVSSTTRDMVGNWEPRLTQVAKDRLPAATSELNAQLQKYADEVGTIIRAKVPQVGTGKRVYEVVKGEIPSPLNPPSGCHFHPRCPRAMARCSREQPVLKEIAPERFSACHLNDE